MDGGLGVLGSLGGMVASAKCVVAARSSLAKTTVIVMYCGVDRDMDCDMDRDVDGGVDCDVDYELWFIDYG